jgi:hypothetical protein
MFRLRPFVRSADEPLTKVSIIIPARNEAGNIGNCLGDLESQDYPQQLLEVVVVNDDSDDLTEEEVSLFALAARTERIPHLKNIRSGRESTIPRATSLSPPMPIPAFNPAGSLPSWITMNSGIRR